MNHSKWEQFCGCLLGLVMFLVGGKSQGTLIEVGRLSKTDLLIKIGCLVIKKILFWHEMHLICGLYNKPITIVNEDSSVVNKLETSLIDDARVIIYDRHMFIVQATKLVNTRRLTVLILPFFKDSLQKPSN